MKSITHICIILLISTSLFSDPIIDVYQYKIKDRVISKQKIYLKKDILFCTGKKAAGTNNNIAAEMIIKGNYKEARDKFLSHIKMAPLFLPFHFNLSIAYIYLNNMDKAIFHLNKCTLLVPRFYPIYIQLAYIYDRKNKQSIALDFYRKALKIHPRNTEVYTLMGDIHFFRKQYRMALKYYRGSLKIDPNYANGLLGEAKILFQNEKYLFAINKLKAITKADDYDISYHFYMAEASYKIRDYKTAYNEYKKLLEYKNDRFFLTNSFLLIQHKMNIAKRFTER